MENWKRNNNRQQKCTQTLWGDIKRRREDGEDGRKISLFLTIAVGTVRED
jgi:hypothetical protein